MKQCPKCRRELKPADIGPVEVEECPGCGGVWFDKDELRRAEDSMDSDLGWLDLDIWKNENEFSLTDSARECPTCRKPMASVAYGETAVVIDCCRSCKGTWLDKDEFRRIVAALEEEVSGKSFSDYVKQAVREGAELFTGHESFISEWKHFVTVLRLMQYRLFVEKPGLLGTITGAQKSAQ